MLQFAVEYSGKNKNGATIRVAKGRGKDGKVEGVIGGFNP
ncbi:outer membrane protein OmpW [Sporosarcina newyorkensis 2681]|uniref:Outer membrane protein OmpW n=1 Tax=Sporosarcina newyorkensis 2681 TaxID=1027292 RepID=F9DY83_9BACL|nr:outer membrane protein OmpW [Sporosarcina newyorkensis 2681]